MSRASKRVRVYLNVERCVQFISEGFSIFCMVQIKLLTTSLTHNSIFLKENILASIFTIFVKTLVPGDALMVLMVFRKAF